MSLSDHVTDPALSNMKEIYELVEATGVEVAYHQPVCLLWLNEHVNCFGCPAELGCSKSIAIGILSLNENAYQMEANFKLVDEVLAAKTAVEVKDIIRRKVC